RWRLLRILLRLRVHAVVVVHLRVNARLGIDDRVQVLVGRGLVAGVLGHGVHVGIDVARRQRQRQCGGERDQQVAGMAHDGLLSQPQRSPVMVPASSTSMFSLPARYSMVTTWSGRSVRTISAPASMRACSITSSVACSPISACTAAGSHGSMSAPAGGGPSPATVAGGTASAAGSA